MYAVKQYRNQQLACVKEEVNGYEISIAFDDSCGALQEMSRSDIRVYDSDGEDITPQIEKALGISVIRGTINNIIDVYNWCKGTYIKPQEFDIEIEEIQ